MADKKFVDFTLKTLWFIAVFIGVPLFIFLFYSILDLKPSVFAKHYSGLLSGLFILLAASIASASVMKSIEASKNLQEESINVTKELKNNEVHKAEQSQLRFIIYTSNQLLMKYTLLTQLIAQCTSQENYDIVFPLIEKQINKCTLLLEQLLQEKNFLFIDKDNFQIIQIIYKDSFFISEVINRHDFSFTNMDTLLLSRISNLLIKMDEFRKTLPYKEQ